MLHAPCLKKEKKKTKKGEKEQSRAKRRGRGGREGRTKEMFQAVMAETCQNYSKDPGKDLGNLRNSKREMPQIKTKVQSCTQSEENTKQRRP